MRNRTDRRESERHAAYLANEAFYNGDPSAQLTVLSTAKRDEVRAVFNYARDILNKHASATIAGLRSEIQPSGPNDANIAAIDAAQQALDAIDTHSGSFTTAFNAALGASVYGDGAFYLSHEDGQVYYRSLHPGDVDVLERSPRGAPRRVAVQLDDRLETWSPTAVEIETNDARQVYANPYGVIPVVLWRNWPRLGSSWGDSHIEHIKAACRLLNERLNVLMWLIRVQGNPPIKVTGVDEAQLTTDPGELWTLPADADAELIRLIDSETIGIHTDTIKLLLQITRELSNTPDVAFGIANSELSGIALKMSYMPMIQAAAVRRGLLGEAIRERNAVALHMTEVLQATSFAGHYDTAIHFDEVTPTDDLAQRDADRNDVTAGLLSAHTYITRHHGIKDPAAELSTIATERQSQSQGDPEPA